MKFIGGLPKNPATKKVCRLVVNFEGTVDLLNHPVLHHDDAGAHGHRLDLIVGHVNHRRLKPLVQFCDFRAHLHAHLRVEV
jgi:hypothetical protein